MNTWRIALVLTVTFAMGSGCAKPDWIQQTLVTVDVTGVWVGSLDFGRLGGGLISTNQEVSLNLEQEGPKVTGVLRSIGHSRVQDFTGVDVSGPIEGAVAGDVLTFQHRDGAWAGEATVSDDELKGMTWTTKGTAARGALLLHRATSPAPSREK